MTKLACNYSIVRFLPYRETGEFVNVGIVLSCPEIGFFDFKLAPRRLGRVRRFFPELTTEMLSEAIQALECSLVSYRNNQSLFTEGRRLNESDVTRAIEEFRWLLKRRETLLHFADPGACLTASPANVLEELYDRFVNRRFAQRPEYQEVVMQRRLAAWLDEWKLAQAYKRNRRVGTEKFYTTLPFVHLEYKRPVKALKPLDLDRDETTAIYDHGDAWVHRIQRLRATGGMPNQIVFAVRLPQEDTSLEAAREICRALEKADVQVVPFAEVGKLRELVEV